MTPPWMDAEPVEIPQGPPPVVLTWFDPEPGRRMTGCVQGRRRETSWREVAALVADPLPWPSGGKDYAPAWTFAVYRSDNRGTKNETRPQDDPPPPVSERPVGWPVEAVYGLSLDYDDEPEAGEALIRRCWGSWLYLAHTTASNGVPKGDKPALPRWRVLLPYTRPVTPAEHERIGRWARHPNQRAGLVGAEAEHPARWYFRPVGAQGGYEWHENDGELLAPDRVLMELADWEADDGQPPPDEWEPGCEPPSGAEPWEEQPDPQSAWEGLEANAPLMRDSLEDLQGDLGRPLLSLAELPPWKADPPPEVGHGIGHHLNDLLGGGVEPGFLCPVGAAYAGAGKTTWLTQLVDGLVLRALSAARGDLPAGGAITPVMLLSELPRKLLQRRTLARFTGWPHAALRDTGHHHHERAWEAARAALAPGSDLVEARSRFLRTITPDVPGGWGLRGEELVARLAEWIGAWKADLSERYPGREVWPIVVVDPIHRFQDPAKNAVEALDELCLALASATRREGWICFATSDTNKQAAAGRERSGDPRERGTAAFRGSYELMHAANVALFLDPLEVPDDVPDDFGRLPDDPRAGGYLAVGVVKNWEGSSLPNRNAWAYYRWTQHLGRFYPMRPQAGEAIRAYLGELGKAEQAAAKKAAEARQERRKRAGATRTPSLAANDRGGNWPGEV